MRVRNSVHDHAWTVRPRMCFHMTTTLIDATALLAVWHRWRDAVRAHCTAIDAMDTEYHARMAKYPANIRHVGLPTFREYARAQYAWQDAAARERARRGAPEHGHVVKSGGAFEAVCPAHPWFRRVAWSRPVTPLSSAHGHNVEYHSGARARVYDRPGHIPSTLLP